jgi:hypothetical protein
MVMQIMVEVPNQLAERLQQFHDRLPELLERGLREIMEDEDGRYFQDETAILELLVSQPAPEQILALHPSPELQARASDLLARSKAGALSRQGEIELERFLFLEHLVRLAKIHAYRQTQHSSSS